jgi:methionyl-tRNA formyltransferase/RimJ/RimL family protein N-acetyltransferase
MINHFSTAETNRLKLVPLDIEFACQYYVNWMNDLAVFEHLDSGGDYTLSTLKSYIENVLENNIKIWAIIIKKENKHIGNVKIDPIQNNSGEYGIMIGDRISWGKGFAKEASNKILEICFNQFNLRQVTLGVEKENIRALKLYKSLGFSTDAPSEGNSTSERMILKRDSFNQDTTVKKNIVILGHGVGVKFTIDSLLERSDLGFEVTGIVTLPFEDHAEDLALIENRSDVYGEYAYNVFSAEKDYDLSLLEAKDVNERSVVKWIQNHNPTYIISIGCRNLLKKEFLSEFPNQVLNIHTTPLPTYRGAANDSWMILNGLSGTRQYGCIHFIDEGIDTGNIVAKSYYNVPERAYPIDVFKTRMNIFRTLLVEGLVKLEDPNFMGEEQKIDDAIYFPRLYTPVNGQINFTSFSGIEIERFVFAFGYPFVGAHCFFEGEKVHLLDVEFKKELTFHSFANGLIFGKNEQNEYKVAVRGGYLLIRKIEIDGKFTPQNKIFKQGKRLS